MAEEPPNRIAVRVPAGCARGTTTLLRRVARAALERHGVRGADISIAVVSDDVIAELNERHLDHAGPTDVLTFDLGDAPRDDGRVCGEIVASLDVATREAQRRAHPTQLELALYVIHGTLHLLGYDDHSAKESARMHRCEDEILMSLGLGAAYRRPPGGSTRTDRLTNSHSEPRKRSGSDRTRRRARAQS